MLALQVVALIQTELKELYLARSNRYADPSPPHAEAAAEIADVVSEELYRPGIGGTR